MAKQQPTTIQPQLEACPVAAIADEFATVVRLSRRLDEKTLDRGNRYQELLDARQFLLTDAAVSMRATSLKGALFQALVGIGIVDLYFDCDSPTIPERSRFRRQLEAVLASISLALELQTGMNREKLGGDYFSCRDIDPFEFVTALEKDLAA